MSLLLEDVATAYWADGVVSPIPIVSVDEAKRHRAALEAAEAQIGTLHYIDKVHTVLTSAFELATHPAVLNVVEALIGPNILLYNVNYIIKEPHTESFIAWHQDLTYWGLADDDAQVSMWLALSPATAESGCMSMIPGSHKDGRQNHREDASDSNLLLLGQRIDEVDSTGAKHFALDPGEASFHHGWTVHTSAPNRSDDRRIGLNVQFLAPHNAHAGGDGTALLVRGEDSFGLYGADAPATSDLEPVAVTALRDLDARMKEGFKTQGQ